MKLPVLLELHWVVQRYVVAILLILYAYRTSVNCTYYLYLTCSAFLKQWTATSYSTFWRQSCQCRIVLFKRWEMTKPQNRKKASLSEQDFLMLWEIFGRIYTQRKQVTSDSLLESPFELSCVCLWNKGEFSWCWINYFLINICSFFFL